MTIDYCKECDCGRKRRIVNKHFYLCEQKNFERLGGKEKKEKAIEKQRARNISKARDGKDGNHSIYSFKRLNVQSPKDKERGNGNTDKSEFSRDNSIRISKRRKRNIKSVSSTSKYYCSDGEVVSQAEINRRYQKVCKEIILERENVCEGTGRTDLPLSNSHTISQRRCKQLGKTELIWAKDNIFLESMGDSTSAHFIWENEEFGEKEKLINFELKLEYIKIHDVEMYQKIIQKL